MVDKTHGYGYNCYDEEYHINLGRYYNIPECCIKFFVSNHMKKIPIASVQREKYGLKALISFDYVPCDKCMKQIIKEDKMGKCYDIPVITIHVSGGVVQDVDIPKDTNAKVLVKDYDCDVKPDSEEGKGHVIREDEHGTYEEGVWEND